MGKFTTVNITSFADIIYHIGRYSQNNAAKDQSDILWFRGHADSSWPLIPSIYRRYSGKKDIENIQLEMIHQFIRLNRHLLHKLQPAPNLIPKKNEYYLWLSIMQHYGYPTCFLDFSERIIPSLIFALAHYVINSDYSSKATACLWVLKPLVLNKVVKNDGLKYEFKGANPNYIPSIEQKKDDNSFFDDLVAITSPYLSDRILAQSGAFVSYPLKVKDVNEDSSVDIEFSLENNPNATHFLEKWNICAPDDLARELKLIGYGIEDVYPSLINRIT
jgi:hypothetical protein